MSSTETQLTIFGEGVLQDLDARIKPFFGAGPFLIVTDESIWKALCPYFSPFLARNPATLVHILPATPAPYASDELVAKIRALLAQGGAIPLAVGAGTINDVTKRAAFEAGRGYVCVPTAPSVDGYTASGAAISVKGFKTTLECPAPRYVIAEEEVIASAPQDLIASGYGDIIAKLSGGADWLIADHLGVEALEPEIWAMVQPTAKDLVGRAAAVRRRDREALGLLYKGLVATGIAMQLYKDSRPASGSEHLLSHVWEMDHLSLNGSLVSHGYKTGFGTLAICAFMNELFGLEEARGSGRQGQDLGLPGFRPPVNLLAKRLAWAAADLRDNPIAPQIDAVIRAKTDNPQIQAARLEAARQDLGALRTKLRGQMPGFSALKACLATAGCPTEPSEIGLTKAEFLRGFRVASLIRKRYTVLDLASEFGVLEETAARAASSPYFTSFSE